MQSAEAISAVLTLRSAANALVAAVDRLLEVTTPRVEDETPKGAEPSTAPAQVHRRGRGRRRRARARDALKPSRDLLESKLEVSRTDSPQQSNRAEWRPVSDTRYPCKTLAVHSIDTMQLAVKIGDAVRTFWVRLEGVLPLGNQVEPDHYRNVCARYIEDLLRNCTTQVQFTGDEPRSRVARLYLTDDRKSSRTLNDFLKTYGLARGDRYTRLHPMLPLSAEVGYDNDALYYKPQGGLYVKCNVLRVLSGDTVIARTEYSNYGEIMGHSVPKRLYHSGGIYIMRLTGFEGPRVTPDDVLEEYKNERKKTAILARDALQTLVNQYQSTDSAEVLQSGIWAKIGPDDHIGRILVIMYGSRVLNCPACGIDRQPALCIRKASKGCITDVKDVACFNRILVGQGHGRENERGLFVWPDAE